MSTVETRRRTQIEEKNTVSHFVGELDWATTNTQCVVGVGVMLIHKDTLAIVESSIATGSRGAPDVEFRSKGAEGRRMARRDATGVGLGRRKKVTLWCQVSCAAFALLYLCASFRAWRSFQQTEAMRPHDLVLSQQQQQQQQPAASHAEREIENDDTVQIVKKLRQKQQQQQQQQQYHLSGDEGDEDGVREDNGMHQRQHQPSHPQPHPQISRRTDDPLEDKASVDYYACCGLGHRLIRMSSAAYVARQRGWALRSFWGWCGEQHPVEVFSYLFRPQTQQELQHVPSTNQIIAFFNEVPGFVALQRTGMRIHSEADARVDETAAAPSDAQCPCQEQKVTSDFEFYSSLRSRFRHSRRLDQYLRANFANAFVIGVHVRAGNGEGGDFVRKGRAIDSPQQYVRDVCELIVRNIFASSDVSALLNGHHPAIYVATDTPAMIELFRSELVHASALLSSLVPAWRSGNAIRLLDLPLQVRPKDGEGVLFGEAAHVQNARKQNNHEGVGDHQGATQEEFIAAGDMHSANNQQQQHRHNGNTADNDDSAETQQCLKGWTDTAMDQLLLSYADVVVAGTPSSFSQTLPMSIALNKSKRKVTTSFCEIIVPQDDTVDARGEGNSDSNRTTGTAMQCYSSFMEWCCDYSTWIRTVHKRDNGKTKTIDKEFIKMLKPSEFVGGNDSINANSIANVNIDSMKAYRIRNRQPDCLRPRRGRIGGGLKDKCLPHYWLD